MPSPVIATTPAVTSARPVRSFGGGSVKAIGAAVVGLGDTEGVLVSVGVGVRDGVALSVGDGVGRGVGLAVVGSGRGAVVVGRTVVGRGVGLAVVGSGVGRLVVGTAVGVEADTVIRPFMPSPG